MWQIGIAVKCKKQACHRCQISIRELELMLSCPVWQIPRGRLGKLNTEVTEGLI